MLTEYPIKYFVFKICRIHKVIMKCGAILFTTQGKGSYFPECKLYCELMLGRECCMFPLERVMMLSLLSYLWNGNGKTIVPTSDIISGLIDHRLTP